MDHEQMLAYAVLMGIICGPLGLIAGLMKDRVLEGLFAGLLLGPFGLLWIVLIGGRKTCPFCRNRVHDKAVVCQHCQRDLSGEEIAIG